MSRFHVPLAVLAAALAFAPGARAQTLNDVGRVLQDQVLGNRNQNGARERDAYEQGRRDAAEQQRREAERRGFDDRRRAEDDRRRFDDDRRRGVDDRDRRGPDDRDRRGMDDRDRRQPGRY